VKTRIITLPFLGRIALVADRYGSAERFPGGVMFHSNLKLAHLRRGIAAFPPRLASISRGALAQYAETLLHEELPRLCAGTITAKGDTDLDALQTKVLAMRLPAGDSALRTNVLDRLTRIDDLRRARVSAAKPFIVWEVWLAVLFLSALTLASPAFFNTENMTLQISMTLMFATGLATLFFIAVRLDYVFCGSTAVSYETLSDVARSLAR